MKLTVWILGIALFLSLIFHAHIDVYLFQQLHAETRITEIGVMETRLIDGLVKFRTIRIRLGMFDGYQYQPRKLWREEPLGITKIDTPEEYIEDTE